MKYKPEDVNLVVTNNGVEQEMIIFYESTCFDECSIVTEEQIECVIEIASNTKEKPKKSKHKSKRCKCTIDWVEVEYGDSYEKHYVNKEHYVNKKPKKGSQSGKQNISSTLLKHLTKSEIDSLRQNKRDAYELMMKMN